jgi:hypothetical protein
MLQEKGKDKRALAHVVTGYECFSTLNDNELKYLLETSVFELGSDNIFTQNKPQAF